jgi:hypothetical protein
LAASVYLNWVLLTSKSDSVGFQAMAITLVSYMISVDFIELGKSNKSEFPVQTDHRIL